MAVSNTLITKDEILRGQSCSPELEENLSALLKTLNKFREVYGKPMIVTSGYRSPEHNKAIGGSAKSAHLTCQAADFRDYTRELANYCLENLPLLESLGLWIEDPEATPTWVHLQIRPTKKRVFKP